MKRKFALIMLCILTVAALAGCQSKEPEYPALEDPKQPSNVKDATYSGFTGSYDADKWLFDSSLGLFTIYDKEVYEAGNPDGKCPNINVVISQDYEGPLTSEDMDDLMAEIENMNVSGFSIEKNEMKTFDGQPIIYYETKAQLTDDMIDIMIENGSITESDIDAVGGRDALMAIGETDQLGISAIVDGKIVMVTGTYYDNSDDVMEAMKLLLKTGKVS